MASSAEGIEIQRAEHDGTYGVKKTRVYGSDGSNLVTLKTDSTGKLQIDSSSGLEIPEHDYIAVTYVAAGNGAGEIETVTFKLGGSGGSTVATLTLAYDANNKLSTVTKS